MGQDSSIEWCHHSANLWHGCVSVNEGCLNCYAETLSKRWGHDLWGNDRPRKEIKSVWKDLAKYQKLAKDVGEVHRVFVGSMMDIFEKPMPLIDSKGNKLDITTEELRQIFFHDVIPVSPNLMFLLLTKRPSNINKHIPAGWKENPPKNVMFGMSLVNQDDNLMHQFLQVRGKKFLSIEPQLAPIDLSEYLWRPTDYCKDCGDGGTYLKRACDNWDCQFKPISWVINGFESGHHRRPFNLDWARSLRDQCKEARVPFFFKQIDKVIDKREGIPADLAIRQFPDHNFFSNAGKEI